MKSVKHPGMILFEQFMLPVGLNAHRLAMHLHVSPQRTNEILHGRRNISPETALRLGKLFGNSAEFWLNLQMEYDLAQAKEQWNKIIEREIKPIGIDVSRKRADSKKIMLSKDQKKVLELLSGKPIHFDMLCRKLGMEAGALAAALTLLEIDNLIKRNPGDFYTKIVDKK